MKASCTECTYTSKECLRNRDLNKEIEKDGGQWVIYINVNNVCPMCKSKNSLKFLK